MNVFEIDITVIDLESCLVTQVESSCSAFSQMNSVIDIDQQQGKLDWVKGHCIATKELLTTGGMS